MSAWLRGYGCTSGAGGGVEAFWRALVDGRDCSQPIDTNHWPVQVAPEVSYCASRWLVAASERQNTKNLLLTQLQQSLDDLVSRHGDSLVLSPNFKWGLILSSTKGLIDDWAWNEFERDHTTDPYSEILDEFVSRSTLKFERSLCVSNACASSLAAIYMAQVWIARGVVERVLVLTVDAVGPFVCTGFQSLRALTSDRLRPFAENRSGLRLGEAAAALVISNEASGDSIRILGTGLDTEGFAATRPSSSGESLARACGALPTIKSDRVDFVVAHGTATSINDAAEDQVFTQIFAGTERPFITATKWAIGHTLGSSAAMDLIAAAEALKRGRLFSIASTEKLDPKFQGGRYLIGRDPREARFRRALVSSLGFGGTHAACLLELRRDEGTRS